MARYAYFSRAAAESSPHLQGQPRAPPSGQSRAQLHGLERDAEALWFD